MRTRSFARVIFILFVLVTSRTAYAQVSLSPTSLSFGNVAVNNTSAVKNVTLANKTTAAISITGITTGMGSPFAVKSTTCGSSLGSSKNCTISVGFAPSALGTVAGTLTINDSGTPSSLAASLSGTGVNPVSVSPNSLSLGNVAWGNNSSAKTITVKNVQNLVLTISSIMASANFKQTNNCPLSPNTLAAGGTCSISVVFTPPALGTTSGTLTVAHNAYGSPTIVNLSGTGVMPVALSPTSVNFGFEKIGATSESRTVELTNEQPVALSLTSIQTTGDFKQTNYCPVPPATLAAGASCSVNVTFAPRAAGIRTGQLSVSDNAVTSPQTVALSGTGGAVLQSISVTPSTASIAVGHTQQFTATGFYNDGSQKNLTTSATWRSSNSKVATVSAGLATSVDAGQTIIVATQSGISGSATLTVSNLTLTSIAVTPANPSIALGTLLQFHATGTYSNGSTLDITNSVTWVSSAAITTISAAGLATSKAIGQSIISATSGTVSGSTVLTVTPAQLVAISVTPLSASIPLGTTQQFTATGTFTDGTMQNLTATATWTSSQTTIAIVTAGLVIPVSTGTVTITATVGSISRSASLTVNAAALVSIAVTPPTPSVALGNSQQFTAAGTYTDGSTQNLTSQASWGSSNTAIASVNSQGLALSIATGATQITATSGSITGSATLTVTPATLVSIAVTPAVPMVPVGETQQFTATGTFTDKSIQDITQTVSWSSSNPAVASISMTTGIIGLATALSQGTSIITATQGAISGSTTLTVNPAVLLSISLSPSPLTLPNGTTQQLVTTGKYSDGTTQTLAAGVIWTSSNVAIATVSTSGLVTAVAATGSATVSAQDGNVTGSLVVQVSSAVLVSIAVSPSTPSTPLGTMQQFTATGTYSDNSTQNLTSSAQWTSSNPQVATISVSSGTAGLAQSLATGSTTITAVSGSVSGTATLTITPAALVSISIVPSAPSIDLGKSQQFTATGTYTDGTSNDLTTTVTWSASPATVAVISNQLGSQGLATSSGVGFATITATLGTVSSSTTLTVGPATIVSIAVTPANSMISVGLTLQFTATATYTDGSTNDVTSAVTWSSSVATIAAMTNNVATGVAPGSLTVTAASGSVQGTASLTVFAVPLISSFAPTATTITSGNSITFTANFANGTGLINPGAIAVNSGVPVNLTPAATTTYTLTVTNAAGTFVTAQTSVTVVPAPAISSFTAGALTITSGASTSLTTVFSNGIGVINPGALSVTSGGAVNVTPAATTTYTLTVTNAAGTFVAAQSTVTVVPPPAIASFTAGANMILVGGSTSLTAVFSGGTGSIDNGVGAVSSGVSANVTPAATTTYVLTVTNAAGTATTATTTVTVSSATLMSIGITPANPSIALSGTMQFTATGTYSDGSTKDLTSTATWNSSAPGVAAISATGLATAVTSGCGGSAVITASYQGVASSITVTITVPGGFACVANMLRPRDPHTATLLNDGRILITGGFTTGTPPAATNTAEIYSPSANSSTPAGNMSIERANHSATLLSNGKVLVVGGVDASNNPISTAEIFDPSANNGQGAFEPTGSMSTARFSHTATLLSDGTVLILGGYASSSPSVSTSVAEIYYPASGMFTPFSGAGPSTFNGVTTSYDGMTIPRGNHTATLLNDGSGDVLITGGIDNYGNSSNTYEIYDPSCTCFYNFANTSVNPPLPLTMNDYRAKHTATLLDDQRVLLVGGDNSGSGTPSQTAEIYDPVTQVMTPTANNPTVARYNHTATLLTTGQVLVAGGDTSGGISSQTATAELYDPSQSQPFGPTTSGGNIATLSVARDQQTATLLLSGNVLFTGGTNSAGVPEGSIELYQPAQTSSVQVKALTVAPSPAPLVAGAMQQFTATGTFKDNSTHTLAGVIWSVSPTTAAEITNDATNQGTALGLPVGGSMTVTACVAGGGGGLVGLCSLPQQSPAAPSLQSISISPATASLLQGTTQQFTATGTLSDGTRDLTAVVTWTSSNTNVATVSAGGLVNSINLGSATLTASFGNVPPGIAQITVNSLTGLTVMPSSSTIPLGKTQQFTATGTLSGGGSKDLTTLATWASTNPAVATVSSTGLAFTWTQGTTNISATFGSWSTIPPASLTVGPPQLSAITITAPSGSLAVGGNATFSATGTDTVGSQAPLQPSSLTWNASPSGFATIIAGVASGISKGNTTIMATATTPSGSITSNAFNLTVYGSGEFMPTPSMVVTRMGHTATLLNSGKVLITGGWPTFSALVNGTSTNSAELYDPATGVFRATGAMNNPRAYHAATLLSNGKVLITGGDYSIGGHLQSAEVYDPTTETFTPTAGSLSAPVHNHTATLLNDGTGRVLVVGGNLAELYDPATGTFSQAGALNVSRAGPTATLLQNGGVLIAGVGTNSVGQLVTWAEVYDPVTNQFFLTAGQMNRARQFHTATLLPSGKVLLAGGSDATAEVYDPTTGYFTLISGNNMSQPRSQHTAVLLTTGINAGKVLVTGGFESGPNGWTSALASADLYDPTMDSFVPAGNMNEARGLHTAAVLTGSGLVLEVGGYDSGVAAVISTAEIYVP